VGHTEGLRRRADAHLPRVRHNGDVRKAIPALLALALLLLLAAPGGALAQQLQADYDFNGNRSSSVAGAPDMTDIDFDPSADNAFATETFLGSPRQVLTFPRGNGLSVSTAGVIPTDHYSIAMVFRFNEVSGWRRLIDFKNGVEDTGLYVLSGALDFYLSGTGSNQPITPSASGDPFHEVILTRDRATGEVVVYADGVEQVRFFDNQGQAIIHPGETLIFFRDGGPVGGEESAGAVAGIRLFDAPLVPTPPPRLGRAVSVDEVSGSVLVGIPARGGSARAAQKGIRFVPLSEVRSVPVGSFLDTKRGTVRLTSARNAAGATQSGTFTGGVFQVLQSRKRSAKGLTNLALKGGSFKRCSARGAARTALSRSAIRRLRSNARGRFRTRGRYSAATVRGTTWTTVDRCDGTLTSVKRGRVAVRDFRRKRTIVVRAGKSYLARPRR
jgi:hypothetical protein